MLSQPPSPPLIPTIAIAGAPQPDGCRLGIEAVRIRIRPGRAVADRAKADPASFAYGGSADRRPGPSKVGRDLPVSDSGCYYPA
jgi:hypothetical protein